MVDLENYIYISEDLISINKQVVIEEDKYSIWAYVVDKVENKIVLDCFLCTRGTQILNSSKVQEFINQGFAPPLSKMYSNSFSIIEDLAEEDIKINYDEGLIRLNIKDIEYAILDLKNKKSYSKSISNSGPYGHELNGYYNSIT